ncbi:hypothetical protein SODALDRAFT_361441 [Sodiomyces alkalinus F11]|uniref:Uncharacterized protein n=1 Tax=Sodiomyces alkalinus (strain CBS 110278 / VKM F-3762 / F11) TaxID=1314773 RepID=A0A3N2PT62_SODAK|nr:hypothetical protein SODALDRAFT_361441 [Sodiomyces alkalinus F11]ROT37709.1 hypothetical protein SODALDRAFT_361441 [Sodiomyces alkalinus F11]
MLSHQYGLERSQRFYDTRPSRKALTLQRHRDSCNLSSNSFYSLHEVVIQKQRKEDVAAFTTRNLPIPSLAHTLHASKPPRLWSQVEKAPARNCPSRPARSSPPEDHDRQGSKTRAVPQPVNSSDIYSHDEAFRDKQRMVNRNLVGASRRDALWTSMLRFDTANA